LNGRNLERITVRSWSAPIVKPPPMAFSPIVVPAVANGIIEFSTNEGITELYDILGECAVIVRLTSMKRLKEGEWENLQIPEEGKEKKFKSYVEWTSDGGRAQMMRIEVTLTDDKNAESVKWIMTDIDDPASHMDVDPNDWKIEKDEPKHEGRGGDNTGVRHPKKDVRWFQEASHKIIKYKESLKVQKDIRKICPRFPLDTLKDYSDTFAKTEIVDKKSSILFQPSNDGGDNFKIVARVLDGKGNSLCSGAEIEIVVWRKFNVKVYAMDDPDNDNFYPGKDLASLKNRFKEAFYPDNDPDHNCYIEMHLEDKKMDAPYAVFEDYPDIGVTHEYTVKIDEDKEQAYHKAEWSHPPDTAQLIGVCFWKENGPPGFMLPYPHAFVFEKAIRGIKRLCVTTPLVKENYDISPKDELIIELKDDKGVKKITVKVKDYDKPPDGKISPNDLKKSINEAAEAAGIPNSDLEAKTKTKGVLTKWAGDDKKDIEAWHFVVIEFNSRYSIRFSSAQNIVDKLTLPKEFIEKEELINIIKEEAAIHEVGFILYNAAGELGLKLDRGRTLRQLGEFVLKVQRLDERYEAMRISENTQSVSRDRGYGFSKFSPLICRDFRCSIFRNFKPDASEDMFDGSPSGD